MNEPFECLLEQLGWEPCIGFGEIRTYYNPNIPNEFVDVKSPTYDFISQIKVEDNKKGKDYFNAIAHIVGVKAAELDLRGNPDLFWDAMHKIHNASLDHRILAHARARGYKEEKS